MGAAVLVAVEADASSGRGRTLGPGWRLTLEALGLRLPWEPMPPPGPVPAWVQWWHINEERKQALRELLPGPAPERSPYLNLTAWADGIVSASLPRWLLRRAVWAALVLRLLGRRIRRRDRLWRAPLVNEACASRGGRSDDGSPRLSPRPDSGPQAHPFTPTDASGEHRGPGDFPREQHPMTTPKKEAPAAPVKGPNLDTPAGLRELKRLLLPLAVTYDEARLTESSAWQAFNDAREGTSSPPPHKVPQHLVALDARDVAIKARRALADGAVRLLVREHALDCPCLLCSLERGILEGFDPSASKEGPAAKARPARRSSKGGGHV